MAPKAKIKQEKQEALKMLEEAFENAKSVVFVDYTGLDVAKISELRNLISENGGKVFVAKNTLLKLAGKNTKQPEDIQSDEVLTGQTAVVFANEDAVAPIQVLGKFASENELPQIKAGIVEGEFHTKEGVIKISKLPGREELVAQVIGAVAGPLYGLVGTLNAGPQNLVMTLEQIKIQKETA